MGNKSVISSIDGDAVSLKYLGLILVDSAVECYFRVSCIVPHHGTVGYSHVFLLMSESYVGHRLVRSLRPK